MLADFLAAGRDTPQALVLDGEAGIGKTTLFEAAVAEAREQGFAVFSCRPAGAETAFSFAALADLLSPVLPEGLERLPLPQRRALSAALLLEEVEGSAPDERAIAFAVFQLLGERGGGPLLVAVDDVQWLDAASASVLAFALRRLAAAPVAILVARRSERRGGGSARARSCVSERAAAAVAARPAECRRHASSAARASRRLVSSTDARPASRHVGRESVLCARARARARAVRWARGRG